MLGVQSLGAALVEHHGVAAQDHGQDPVVAGQASRFGGGDAGAGVERGDAGPVELAEQVGEGHGDDDGGVAPTGLRQVAGAGALDQLAQRLAATHREGAGVALGPLGGCVARVWCVGPQRRHDRLELLAQHVAVQLGEAEAAVDDALVVLVHLEGDLAGGACLLGLEQSTLVVVGVLGTDHGVDPSGELLEGLGVVGVGEVDQVLLGPAPLVGVDGELARRGQQVEPAHDRAGLVDAHRPGPDAGPEEGVAVLEVLCQREVGPCRGPGLPGGPCGPVGGVAVTGVDRGLVAVGGQQHLKAHGFELGLCGRERGQGVLLVLGAHRPHRHRRLPQPLQPGEQPVGEVGHRVALRHRLATPADLLCHGPIQAVRYDSPAL